MDNPEIDKETIIETSSDDTKMKKPKKEKKSKNSITSRKTKRKKVLP
jgi:hypothetical protein